MQMNQALRSLEIGGTDAPITDAQILATPQMFKVLYDSLYTHKEEAIVRELLCNAWDAHVAAGTTDTPINIHLPTLLEPWFQITDYGTGLAPDDVIGLYMNYGASNKRDTNALIGGFGLGSKTPYCYTDQFTVTSRWHGTAYTFQAFLKETGAPACTKIGEAPTDEPNGLTIYVPIGDSYTAEHEFQRALTKFLPHISTTPIINKQIDVPPSTIAYEMESDHPDIAQVCFDATQARDLTILMGLVPYQLPSHDIQSYVLKLLHEDLHVFARRTFRRNIMIKASIGAFEVVASREHLSLTEDGRKKVAEILASAIAKLHAHLTKLAETAEAPIRWMNAIDETNTSPPVPAKWTHLITRRGGSTHPNNYILELASELNLINTTIRKALHPDHGLRRKYNTFTPRFDTNGLNRIDAIYVAPSSSFSVHNFAEEHYKPDPAHPTADLLEQHLLFLKGDLDTTTKKLRELGFTQPIRPMPKIAKKNAAHSGIRGKTAYPYQKINLDTLNTTSHSETLDDLAQQIDEEDFDPKTTLFQINKHLGPYTDLDLACKFGLIRRQTRFKKLIILAIPEQHTRVRQTLCDALKTAGFTLTENLRDHVKANPQRIRRYRNLQALYTGRADQRTRWYNLRPVLDYLEKMAAVAPSTELEVLAHKLKRFQDQTNSPGYATPTRGQRLHQLYAALNALKLHGYDTLEPLPGQAPPFEKAYNRRVNTLAALLDDLDKEMPGLKDLFIDKQLGLYGATSTIADTLEVIARTYHHNQRNAS